MSMQRQLWTLSALSVEIQIDRCSLARLLDGLPPAAEAAKGKRVERRWYLADVVRHLGGGAGSDRLDLSQERARLAKAQTVLADLDRQRKALALARERGELVSAAAVQAAWTHLLAVTRARLLAIPAATATELAVTTTPAETSEIVRRAIYAALTELAEAPVVVVEPEEH